jgi:hypothetical protein
MHQVTEAVPLSELSRSQSDTPARSVETKSEAVPASMVAVAVMVGALGLSVTDTLPGGLSGGGGFLLGLVGALVVFSGLSFATMLREQKSAR